jgi:ribosomal protein S18 acetylase RimI-like enzyme
MAQAAPNIGALPDGLVIRDLASFSVKDRQEIVNTVSKIEKKTFPSSEAFDFDSELKKRNASMLLATREGDSFEVAGYLVYLRTKRLALLHKICVIERMRENGIGKCLVHSLRLRLEGQGGSQRIQLWVDENRSPARALYKSCNFQEIDRCADYYGPGRHGIKMQLSIEK